MGRVKQARREADRVAKDTHKRARGQRLSTRYNYVSSQTVTTDETQKLFDQFPALVQERLAKVAIEAASKAVRQETKKELSKAGVKPAGTRFAATVGRSKKTKTQDGWSAKTRLKRNRRGLKVRAKGKEMYFVIRSRAWKKRQDIIGKSTGPLHKYAAQGHLLEYGGYRTVLWGKATMVERVPPRPFMRPAVKRSMKKQEQYVRAVFKKWADKI